MPPKYDAVVVVSFGGPEGPDDVLPFLRNVVRGRPVPEERLRQVAEHYHLFGGVSPHNAHVRALVAALDAELKQHGLNLPVYWGNRNWHPMLEDTVRQMAHDGVRRALAFVTSGFGSYSSCRQFLDDIQRARESVGPDAPWIDKLRLFYDHPGFIEPMTELVGCALAGLGPERRAQARLVFTAHSIPLAMAGKCRYVEQLEAACRLVAQGARHGAWSLVYQSRSGPPTQPWLEPDVCEHLRGLGDCPNFRGEVRENGTVPFGGPIDVVLVPIGFLAEHMEVIYDLDVEAAAVCRERGINLIRVSPVGARPRFVRMIRELVEERLTDQPARPALSGLPICPDACPADCCPPR